MTTPTTRLADLEVSSLGFGCMALSHVYGGGLDDGAARATLDGAIDAGITFLDTANVYGEPRPGTDGPAGTNEEMIAPLLARRREEVQIATKFGITGLSLVRGEVGTNARPTNGEPSYVREQAEASLRRLGVDVIDLYYLHRPDPLTPIEDTVGAMADLVQEGKVRHLGLSEVTADELGRAHGVHPITAVQSEWSLWSRDVEARVVPACAELGVGFVPYSPLGRGFLTGTLTRESVAADFRSSTQRMGDDAWDANARALDLVTEVANEVGATNAQVALAWLLEKARQTGVSAVPIPGSRRVERMRENLGCLELTLTSAQMQRLDGVAALVEGGRNIVDDPAWISSGRE
ncbi:aldo/keto reductase [Dermacoccus sp. PAMC28757]|uniref:aldo/keto reductase n=1 Tax=Dermacoccus sp. PAMC28757 TaxID=2762331 RepID=UPI00164D7519|nr:aldo/keto reductase [Dermacoccus sp. PAMC28757]QNK53088.1 aldo/keto reductase [Dermacoccus sp. PAMC28757]